MFMAPSVAAAGDRDRDVVDLTGDDDGDLVETGVVHSEGHAASAAVAAPSGGAPPDAWPRRKRRSEKQRQIERAFKSYLASLDPTQRSVVLRGFAKISQQKDGLLRMRQQLKTELQGQPQPAQHTRSLNSVESALCNIDEYIVGIRQGRIPATDVPGVARAAAHMADGIRHRLDAAGREQAISALQDEVRSVSSADLLNDPAYVDARARSLVTADPSATASRYVPAVNPVASGQILYQEALNDPLMPGWLPDGSIIRAADGPSADDLPFFNQPPDFNRPQSNAPDPGTEALVDLAKNDAPPLDMPYQLNCTTLEHQRQGLGWLVRAERGRNKGSILADDMGLGKTLQTIALMYANPPSDTDDPGVRQVLVVCPVALIQTWADELRNRVHEQYRMRVYVHHRASNESRMYTRASDIRTHADVVICTYHAVMYEYKHLEREREHGRGGAHPLFDMKWHRIVLDEAHAIKNRNSQVSQACAHLRSRYRLCLTGTPMQNRIDELFPLVRFLRISPYGDAYWEFKALVPLSHSPGTSRFQSQKALAAFLSAVMLRRLKDTVINGRKIIDNLPQKHVRDVYVNMEGEEKENYSALEMNVSDEVNRLSRSEEQLSYNNMLVLLLRMRQTACHPLLVSLTKKGRGTQVWGENSHTRSEVNTARHVEPHAAAAAMLNSDDERLCVVCGGPSADMHESYIYGGCGDTLCAECALEARSQIESEVSDGNSLGSITCPKCRVRSYYVANLEIVDVIRQQPGLPTSAYVDIVVRRQQPRVEEYRRGEQQRRQRMDELRYDENNLVELLLDSDDEDVDRKPGDVDRKPGDLEASEPGESKILEYKIDVNEVTRLFHVQGVFPDSWVTSKKIEACLDVLRDIWREAPNDKVIVFSSFTSLLDVMTIPLEAAREPFLTYTGKMDAQDRNNVLREFREGACRVLLTSMKAGNVGLTLTQANRVIILEPFWNPYVEEQAQDRVYRIGQSREVTIYRIRVRDTVEDRIVELQDKKRDMIEGALDPSMKAQAQGLSRSDLMFVLGLHTARGSNPGAGGPAAGPEMAEPMAGPEMGGLEVAGPEMGGLF